MEAGKVKKAIDANNTELKEGDVVRIHSSPAFSSTGIISQVADVDPTYTHRGNIVVITLDIRTVCKKSEDQELTSKVKAILDKERWWEYAYTYNHRYCFPESITFKYRMEQLCLNSRWVYKEKDENFKINKQLQLYSSFSRITDDNEFTAAVNNLLEKAVPTILTKLREYEDLKSILKPLNKELKELSKPVYAKYTKDIVDQKFNELGLVLQPDELKEPTE